jgi:hypothetical protein
MSLYDKFMEDIAKIRHAVRDRRCDNVLRAQGYCITQVAETGGFGAMVEWEVTV